MWNFRNYMKNLYFFVKKNKLHFKSTIRRGFLDIFGISLYKFSLISKGCGYSLLQKKKKLLKQCKQDQINWFKFFLNQNFIFGVDLRNYLKVNV